MSKILRFTFFLFFLLGFFIIFFSNILYAQNQSQSGSPASSTNTASSGSSTSFFSDVPADHWAYQALVYLFSINIIQGYKDGTFKGDRPITRYEMALMIFNLIMWIKKNYDITTTSTPGSTQEMNEIINSILKKSIITEEEAKLIKDLVNEFRIELEDIKEKIASLEKRVLALENNNTSIYLSSAALVISIVTLIIVLFK
jgi:polyhydroxyalkanoate synthesis regulator phasin